MNRSDIRICGKDNYSERRPERINLTSSTPQISKMTVTLPGSRYYLIG